MEKHASRRTTLKLHLKKERIRNLVSSELAQAHGGARDTGCNGQSSGDDPPYGHTYYHC